MSDILDDLGDVLSSVAGDSGTTDILDAAAGAGEDDLLADSLGSLEMNLGNLLGEDALPTGEKSGTGLQNSRSGLRAVSRVNTYRAMPSAMMHDEAPAAAPQGRHFVAATDDDSDAGLDEFGPMDGAGMQMPKSLEKRLSELSDGNGADKKTADMPRIKSAAQSDGLPSVKATGLPSVKAAGLPSVKEPGLPSVKAAGLPSVKEPGLPSVKAAELPSVKEPGLPSVKAAGLPSVKEPGLPSVKAAGLPSVKEPGLPSVKEAGLPSVKEAGLPSVKAAGLPSVKPAIVGAKTDNVPSAKIIGAKSDDKHGASPISSDGIPSFKVPELTANKDKAPDSAQMRHQSLFASIHLGDSMPGSKAETASNQADTKPPKTIENAALNSSDLFSPDVAGLSAMSENLSQQNLSSTQNKGVSVSDSIGGGISVPKLNIESGQQPVIHAKRRPTGAFEDNFDLDNDSGLPISDDPLGILEGDAASANSGTSPSPQQLVSAPVPQIPDVEMPNFANVEMPKIPDIENIEMPKIPDVPELQDPRKSTPTKKPVPELPNGDILNLFSQPDAAPSKPVPPAQPMPPKPPVPPKPATAEKFAVNPAKENIDASKIPAPVEANDGRNGATDPVTAALNRAVESTEQMFDLQSIKNNQSKPLVTSVSRTGAKSHKKTRCTLTVVIVAAVVVICLGIAFYNHFLTKEEPVQETVTPVAAEPVIPLSWAQVMTDQQAGYLRYYKMAREKLGGQIDENERREIQGKILILFPLAATRYANAFADDIEMIEQSVPKISESCENEWCALGLWSWGVFRDDKALCEKFESRITTQTALKQLVEAAHLYQTWNTDGERNDAIKSAGDAILAAIPTDPGFIKEWPLATWLKAQTLARLGRFDEAAQAIDNAYPEADTLSHPATMLLKAELLLANEKNADAAAVTAAVEKIGTDSEAERVTSQYLSLLADSGLKEWSEIEPGLTELLKTTGNNAYAAGIVADVCKRTNHAIECRSIFHPIVEIAPQIQELRVAYLDILLHGLDTRMIVRPDEKLNDNLFSQINQVIEEGIRQTPTDKRLWRGKGIIEYAADHYENAIRAFDEVERGTTIVWSGAFLRLVSGWNLADEQGRQDIIKKLNEFADYEMSPFDMVILAECLQFVGQTEQAVSLVSSAVRMHPESTELRNLQFNLAVSRQDKSLANEVVTVLKNRRALRSEHEYGLAKLTEQLGDINAALETMLALMNREKDNPEYVYYVGQLFFKQGHYDSAIQYFDRTLEMDPSRGWAHFYRGRTLYELGKFDEALVSFNNAYAQDDTNFLFRLWHGLSLEKAGQPQEAVRAYTSVLDAWSAVSDKSLSNVTPEVAAEAFYHRAELIKLQNRRSDARGDFSAALEIAPDNVQYMSGYAIFLYENQQHKDAISYLDKVEAVHGDTMDARLCFVKGLTLLKLNKREDALKYLEAARDRGFVENNSSEIQGVREPAEVYERLGYLYRDMGRKDDARKSLNLFLEKSTSLSPSARLEVQREIDKI